MSKIPADRSSSAEPKPVFRAAHRNSVTAQRVSFNGTDSFATGDRVIAAGKSGTVAFVGPTRFAEGQWFGIILDEAQGKNDGSYDGVRYFQTTANRGLFCRSDKLQRAPSASRLSTIAIPEDPTPNDLQVNDRVIIRGAKYGTLKYIGNIHVADGIWCGIKLDEPVGKNNGKVGGVRYFHCQHRFGLFAPVHRVEKVPLDAKQLQMLARQSMISTGSFGDFQDGTSDDEDTPSELSNSSHPRSPPVVRHSAPSEAIASHQQQLSDLTAVIKEKDQLIDQLQERGRRAESSQLRHLESLLKASQEQTVAKDTQNKSLITEQFQLLQRVETLQFQLEEYELKEQMNKPEDHQAFSFEDIEQYEETKGRILELESINSRLKLDKQALADELRTKVDYAGDLQRQIELFRQRESKNDQAMREEQKVRSQLLAVQQERDIADVQLRNLQGTIVPNLEAQCQMLRSQLDDQVSARDSLYEQERLLQRTKTDGLVEELKVKYDQLQRELAEANQREQVVSGTLSERQMKYDEQIREYERNLEQAVQRTQAVQNQLVELEQDKSSHDHKANEAIDSLKEDYERQYAQLQNQLVELQDRDQRAASSEEYYQELLDKHTQEKDQAGHEIQDLRSALTKLDEEKAAHEKRLKETISTLQQTLENVQTEMNDRESRAKVALNEQQTDYDKQIREYERNLEQAMQRTQAVQNQLVELQQDKSSHDHKANETIGSLKEDYERQYEQLQIQLVELQDRDHTQAKALEDREAYYQSLLREYQAERERALAEVEAEKARLEMELNERAQDTQSIRTELEQLRDEMASNERRLNETISELQQDQDRIQSAASNERAESTAREQQLKETIERLQQECDLLRKTLAERDRELTMAEKKRYAKYEEEIDEYQKNLELAVNRNDEVQSELDALKEQKWSDEDKFIEMVTALRAEIHALQEQKQTNQTAEMSLQIEALSSANENLKNDLEDMKNANDAATREHQTSVAKFTQDLAASQKAHQELLEKQIEMERQWADEKVTQEKVNTEKIGGYEMKIALMKSEYMVEMENAKLDYDQEVLKLKTKLQQVPAAKKK